MRIDKKLAKKINTLYRNCKQMPLLCILGLFVPLVLPFIVPLCLVYASQRTKLLNQLGNESLEYTTDDVAEAKNISEEVEFIRVNGGRFYLPIFIAVGVAAIIGVLLIME